MQENDHHATPFKNWKQLVGTVALAFAVPIAVAVIISQWVTGGMKGANETDDDVIKRIMPVGEVQLASMAGPKAARSGEDVYNQVCKNCHESGLAGAPKFGDKAAWAKVIAQGQSVAVGHAQNGIRAMPAKGGNPDLDNSEVERAVVFMANRGGANWKAPPLPAARTMPDRTGEQVVQLVCSKCHATGVNGAPRIGDRDQWRERVMPGYKLVLDSALRGHAGMPARGGMAELSDAEVGRAVEYMMNAGAGKMVMDVPVSTVPPAAPGAAAPADHDHATHTAAATPAAAAPAGAGAAEGKKVYESTCVVCHGAGIAGAPKFGDKAQWAPRIAQGINVLFAHAQNGLNAMPPRGGDKSLSDAKLRAAIDYMVAASK